MIYGLTSIVFWTYHDILLPCLRCK